MNDWTSNGDPLLTRFRFATVGTGDLDGCERDYASLGYHVRESGAVGEDLAASWGTPGMAGRRYVILSTAGASEDYIRLVETDPVPEYRALTTFGWAAFEIIVDDVHQVHELIKASAFTVIGEPKPLQFMPSIVAMQAVGPSGECLYFTMESGDRSTSILPRPRSLIDRPFILVIAGPDFDALRNWYCDLFDLKRRPLRDSRISLIQAAQGLAPDTVTRMTTAGLRDHGYLFEFDEYPPGPGLIAGPRPRASGMLPPGCAMASIATVAMDRVAPLAITPPVRRDGPGYDGRLACTVRGPAGELIEFIEEAA
ncbi:MAG: VOC family protein [Candidatus Sphingomonas phytovorans]|nr:VOC family protein [Sphingomonas sp.]WEK01172.1 MAG: VOC family protein [Sphingomonas sp.]